MGICLYSRRSYQNGSGCLYSWGAYYLLYLAGQLSSVSGLHICRPATRHIHVCNDIAVLCIGLSIFHYLGSALEVERVLLECAGIVDVAVIGWPDDVWGEKIVAAVLISPQSKVYFFYNSCIIVIIIAVRCCIIHTCEFHEQKNCTETVRQLVSYSVLVYSQ